MRRLLPIALLGVSIVLAGCSSGTTATSAPGGATPAAATPASATPEPAAATPEPAAATPEPAAATPAPAADDSALGQQFSQIQTEMQTELAKAMAGMAMAKSPADIATALKAYAAVARKAIAQERGISWPAAISGDMDKFLNYQDELLGVMEKGATDPSAIDQAKLEQITAEMPAIAQRIAAYFGVQTP